MLGASRGQGIPSSKLLCAWVASSWGPVSKQKNLWRCVTIHQAGPMEALLREQSVNLINQLLSFRSAKDLLISPGAQTNFWFLEEKGELVFLSQGSHDAH